MASAVQTHLNSLMLSASSVSFISFQWLTQQLHAIVHQPAHTLPVFTLVLFFITSKYGYLRGHQGKPLPFLARTDVVLRIIYLIGGWLAPLLLTTPPRFHRAIILFIAAYLPSYLDGSEQTGERAATWLQRHPLWATIGRSFFDLKLVRASHLSASQHYVFAVHPSPVLPYGTLLNLCTEANHFSQVLPQVKLRLLSSSFLFYMPLLRDLMLALGCCDAAKYPASKLLSEHTHCDQLCYTGYKTNPAGGGVHIAYHKHHHHSHSHSQHHSHKRHHHHSHNTPLQLPVHQPAAENGPPSLSVANSSVITPALTSNAATPASISPPDSGETSPTSTPSPTASPNAFNSNNVNANVLASRNAFSTQSTPALSPFSVSNVSLASSIPSSNSMNGAPSPKPRKVATHRDERGNFVDPQTLPSLTSFSYAAAISGSSSHTHSHGYSFPALRTQSSYSVPILASQPPSVPASISHSTSSLPAQPPRISAASPSPPSSPLTTPPSPMPSSSLSSATASSASASSLSSSSYSSSSSSALVSTSVVNAKHSPGLTRALSNPSPMLRFSSPIQFPSPHTLPSSINAISALPPLSELSAIPHSDNGPISLAIFPGGMKELMYSHPGPPVVFTIFLRRRRGFIRLALETGAAIVPVFTFGEIYAHRQFVYADYHQRMTKKKRSKKKLADSKSNLPDMDRHDSNKHALHRKHSSSWLQSMSHFFAQYFKWRPSNSQHAKRLSNQLSAEDVAGSHALSTPSVRGWWVPLMRAMNDAFYHVYGLTLPILQDFIPRRCAITTVIGKPIAVPKLPPGMPVPESVVHQLMNLYVDELTKLFYENKEKYMPGANAILRIV